MVRLHGAGNLQRGQQRQPCLLLAVFLCLIRRSTCSWRTNDVWTNNEDYAQMIVIQEPPFLNRIFVSLVILVICAIAFMKLSAYIWPLLRVVFSKQASSTPNEQAKEVPEPVTPTAIVVRTQPPPRSQPRRQPRIFESWLENSDEEPEGDDSRSTSYRRLRQEEQSHCSNIRSRSPVPPTGVHHRSHYVKSQKFRVLEKDEIIDFTCGILNTQERRQLLDLLPRAKALRKLHLDITYWSSEEAQKLSDCLEKSQLEEVMFFQKPASPFSPAPPSVHSRILSCLLRGIATANLKRFIIDSQAVPISSLAQISRHVEELEIRQVDRITGGDANCFALSLKYNPSLHTLRITNLDGASFACLLNAMAQNLSDKDHLQFLHAKYVDQAGMQALGSFLQCCNLETLVLEHIVWSDSNMRPLEKGLLSEHNHVSKLEFQHCGFSPDTYPGLLRLLQHNDDLVTFSSHHLQHSRYNRYNEALGMALSQFQSTSLKTLELVHSIPEPQDGSLRQPFSWEAVLASLIRHNPQLQVLSARDNYLGMRNQHLIPFMDELSDKTCLKRLDLSNGCINHVGVLRLVEKMSPTLQYLNLSRSPVGDEGAVALAQWLTNPKCPIAELILDWCKLTPVGVRAILKALAHNGTLTKLTMMWCDPLGQQGLEILAESIPNVSAALKQLSISSLPNLHPQTNLSDARFKRPSRIQIAAFQKALVRAARGNTSLTRFQVLVPPGLPKHVLYYGCRNELYHFLRHNENNPQLTLERLMSCMRDCLHRPQADEATNTTTTQLTARAIPSPNRRYQPKPPNKENWDVSLWYDCLTRRPDLLALLNQR